jgi:hypothetical protein
MTGCDRCYIVAELGQCPFCHRELCVVCYDGDQEDVGDKQKCRSAPIEQRDNAIRALRGGGMSRNEVAERFGLSTMTISRVMRE